MKTDEWPQASHGDDIKGLRKWMPLVVPLCAVVLSMLVFLIGFEVLIRP
jgi:hypothetical protein